MRPGPKGFHNLVGKGRARLPRHFRFRKVRYAGLAHRAARGGRASCAGTRLACDRARPCRCDRGQFNRFVVLGPPEWSFGAAASLYADGDARLLDRERYGVAIPTCLRSRLNSLVHAVFLNHIEPPFFHDSFASSERRSTTGCWKNSEKSGDLAIHEVGSNG
jgi:hypothetical protein